MKQEKQMSLIVLGVFTIWDAFTTITGTARILGNSSVAFFLSVIFAVMITALLIKTIPIMYNPKEDMIHVGAKMLCGLALMYDLYTSFIGNSKLVTSGRSSLELEQIFIIIGMTIFTCSSPIAISYILYIADDDITDNDY